MAVMKNFLALGLLFLLLLGCGGGGGSDSSSGVRVFQGSLEAPAVFFLSSNSTSTADEGVEFGETSSRGGIESGEQQLILFPANSAEPALSSVLVDLDSTQRYSLYLYGDEQEGFAVGLLLDEASAPEGEALIRVVHLVSGVSVVEAGISNASGFASFGSSSPYFSIAPGPQRIRLSDTSTGFEIASITADFEAGIPYTLFVAGEKDFFVIARLVSDSA